MNVFAEAVTACREFVVEEMGGDGIYDKEMIILFALDHGMDKFAKILVKDLMDDNGEEKIEEKNNEEKKLEDMYREECPVCLNVFTSSMKIQQCTQGHFTCEPCRNKMECCSECREPFMGRAFGYERILRNNYNKQQSSEDPVMVNSSK